MTDNELVKRLRLHYRTEGLFVLADAADAIERLTRERDEARSHLRDVIDNLTSACEYAEAAERKVEKLREALEPIAAFNDEPGPRVYKLDGVMAVLVHYDVIRRVSKNARAALDETEDNLPTPKPCSTTESS